VYTIKCTAGWITQSSGAWLQWGTCTKAGVMLFEQLAQFSSACSNVSKFKAVVPHREKKKKSQSSPVFSRIDFIQFDPAQTFGSSRVNQLTLHE